MSEPQPPEATPPPEEDALARRAIRINRPQRAAAGVVGGALLVVASWAVLDGTDGTALLAFVVMGGLFALLAIVGVVPTRIKSGEHVLELYETIDQQKREIEAAVNVMDATQLEEAALQIEPPPTAGRNRSALHQAAELENLAMHQLQEALRRLELPAAHASSHQDRAWDAQVLLPDGRFLLVEVKLRLIGPALGRIIARRPGDLPILIISPEVDDKVLPLLHRLQAGPHDNVKNIEVVGTSVEEIMAGVRRLISGAAQRD